MRRLQLLGHLARRPDEEDHQRVLLWYMVSAMSNPPTGWRRPRGRLVETWLRIVSKDVQPFNIDIHSAWHRAADRQQWYELIDSAICSSRSMVRHQGGGAISTDNPTVCCRPTQAHGIYI